MKTVRNKNDKQCLLLSLFSDEFENILILETKTIHLFP